MQSGDINNGQKAGKEARPAVTPEVLLAVLGLAFYWPFFPRFEFTAVFGLYPDAESAMWGSFSTVMLSLALFLVLGVALCAEFEGLLARRRVLGTVLCSLGSVGYLMMYVAPLTEGASSSVGMFGGLLVALSYAVLTFVWMSSVASMGGLVPYLVVLVSFTASNLLSMAAYIPGPTAFIMTLLAPSVSAVAWLMREKLVPPAAKRDSGSLDTSLRSILKLPLALVAVFVLFLFTGRIIVGLLYFGTGVIPMVQRVSTIVIVLVVFGIMMAALLKVKLWEAMFQTSWAFLALIFLVGMLMLLPLDETLFGAGTGILSASLSCFEILLWLLLIKAVKDGGLSAVMVFGLATLLVRVIPHYCGKFLVPALASNAEVVIMDHLVFIVIGLVFLLMATTVLFINARLFRQLQMESGEPAEAEPAQALTADPTVAFEASVERLAASAGLTPREMEVMLYMAQGFSYQRIADELCISLGTTQGHAKNVYRKLDVHSKQDLIDAVRRA